MGPFVGESIPTSTKPFFSHWWGASTECVLSFENINSYPSLARAADKRTEAHTDQAQRLKRVLHPSWLSIRCRLGR